MTAERDRALKHLKAVEEGLREMADEVAREITYATDGGRELFSGRQSAFVNCAERVVHGVTWGVANLHLERMMIACFDAVRAEEEPT